MVAAREVVTSDARRSDRLTVMHMRALSLSPGNNMHGVSGSIQQQALSSQPPTGNTALSVEAALGPMSENNDFEATS